ncbi:unnamed protein product [Colias eurytheme]|nr:unnamed protein product [Colias eurytheme]
MIKRCDSRVSHSRRRPLSPCSLRRLLRCPGRRRDALDPTRSAMRSERNKINILRYRKLHFPSFRYVHFIARRQ